MCVYNIDKSRTQQLVRGSVVILPSVVSSVFSIFLSFSLSFLFFYSSRSLSFWSLFLILTSFAKQLTFLIRRSPSRHLFVVFTPEKIYLRADE
ncbi:hypothetical protein F5B18DRAFT_375873 [Nemania serpens]|nr:hypothetical protein F5B18DRAFT_375873 [Nemania serpens]